MQKYLVFRLYGPMASWGQAAVGGDRPTGMQPTRSAILGLLGAALGIKREQHDILQQLRRSINVSVKQCAPSSLIRDYHTSQVPASKKGVLYRTRKAELSVVKLQTILSSRDYRCDGLWIVAVSITQDTSYTLEKIQEALLKPVFALYLGRKSCPPALPLMPIIIETATLKQALDTEFPSVTFSHKSDDLWLNKDAIVTYYWQGDINEFDAERVQTNQPWDEPVNRSRWQFTQCEQHQISLREKI